MNDIDKINRAGMGYAEKKHNHDFSTFYTPQLYATANDFMEGAIWYRDNMTNSHNEGVDACIAKLEKVKILWENSSFKSNPSRKFIIDHYNELIEVFEQLKKPLS